MGSLVHEDRKIFSSKGCFACFGMGQDGTMQFLVGPWNPILIPCIPQEGDMPMFYSHKRQNWGLNFPPKSLYLPFNPLES